VVADWFLAGAVEFFAIAEGDMLGGANGLTRHGNDCKRGENEAGAEDGG
jgi:hypothetical protein